MRHSYLAWRLIAVVFAVGWAHACGGNGFATGGPAAAGGDEQTAGDSNEGGIGANGSAVGGSAGSILGLGGSETAGTSGEGGSATGGNDGEGGHAGGSGGGGSGQGGASGGPPTTCDVTWAVGNDGYVRSPSVSGCWHGYAYTYADNLSTVTPSTYETCGAACVLCASGTIGKADYSSASLGVNVNQTVQGVVETAVPTGNTLIVNFTKTGSFPLRVQLNGAKVTDRWCAEITATTGPVAIPWGSFNTRCWEPVAGTPYTRQHLSAVELLVPGTASGTTSFAMCLAGARDG